MAPSREPKSSSGHQASSKKAECTKGPTTHPKSGVQKVRKSANVQTIRELAKSKEFIRHVTRALSESFPSTTSRNNSTYRDPNDPHLKEFPFPIMPEIKNDKVNGDTQDINMKDVEMEDTNIGDFEMEDDSEEPWIGDMLLKSLEKYERKPEPQLASKKPSAPVRPPLLRNMFDRLGIREDRGNQ